MKRRHFLTMLASTGIAVPAIGSAAPAMRMYAHAASPDNPLSGGFSAPVTHATDNVLVLLRLFGGNDGLNTFVPYQSSDYYYARRKSSGQDISIAAERVLKIHNSSTMGFHPALKPLHTLYEEKKVCVIQNVGYPEQDLSHFRSNDIWLSGTNANEYKESGWLGRFLEERYPDYPNVLPRDPFAVEVGRSLGRTFMGEHTHLGVNIADTSFVPVKPRATAALPSKSGVEQEYIRQMMLQSSTFLQSALRAEDAVGGKNRVQYPDTDWAKSMAFVGRMIAGGMATQVYLVNMPLWDFHLNQINDQRDYLEKLSGAMYAFQRDMEACGVEKRVTMMTVSEFGRRVTTSESGTDHGAGSCMFVVGAGVQAGIIGYDPDVSSLDANENLKWHYDFRQIYASVLSQWFGAKESDMASALMQRRYTQVPIFQNHQLRAVSVDADATSNIPTRTRGITAIYPQPASDTLTLEFAGLNPRNYAVLTLVDLQGRQMLAPMPVAQSVMTVNVRSLASGHYLAMLHTPHEHFTAKVQVLR
jgi:uncharacterized protein (DUF1501 family)